MKHFLPNSLRALFLSLAVLLSLPMLAVEVEIDGINYDLDAEAKQATVKAKSSGKYSGEVIIPESVAHEGAAYSVTSIGSYAFSGCSGLTSVTIGNSVTSIGAEAFWGCSGLTSVHISDIVAWCNIDFYNSESNPFYHAKCLYINGEEVKDLVIPNSVESIGRFAFYDCSSLTSVTIPNSVTSIGDYSFWDCDGLTSVTIGNSVKNIGELAFRGCRSLTSVIIPNSVTSIGDDAFLYCHALTSLTIGRGVESIGEYAFSSADLFDVYCYAKNVPSTENFVFYGSTLKNATLHVPNASVDSYKANAPWSSFGKIIPISTEIDGINYDFDAETQQATVIAKSSGKYSGEVVIPESVEHEGAVYSVTIIGGSAFRDCSGLTSVTIPNSVKSIESSAFSYCSGLTSVTIGNSVTIIGGSAFHDCYGLTSVHISDIAAWCNIDFAGNYSNPLVYAHHLYLNGEEVKDLVIPNSVTSIGDGAFFHCYGLTSVTISNSVTSIVDHAFASCSGLTSVTIGNSVTSIGDYAFRDCSGLTSVTIPNSVTSMGHYAFRGCSGLTSVTIGNGVKSIGKEAFSNCPELLDVYCYAEKVPSTYSDAFDGSYPGNATLHVPNASINSYKSTAPWSGFGKIVGLSGEEPEQPEVEKCATPVVTYVDGCLEISCDTDGANYVTKLVAEDANEYYESKIELSATYNIEVYAAKANYENSDTVSVALVWVENGEVNEETGVISVPAAPVLVQGNGGILTVSGVVQNTEVVVYTIDGMEVDRAVASDGTAMIYTGLQSGTIVVVKFGNKSVKVRI